MSTADRILHEAMQLGDGDRAAIASRLIDSLDVDADDDVVPAWADEIQRRLRELDDGSVTPLSWEEARRLICEPNE